MDRFKPKKLKPLEPMSFETHFDQGPLDTIKRTCEPINSLNFVYPDGTQSNVPVILDSFEYIDVPASRWQAFKEKHFPKWLKWIWPVKYNTEISVGFKTLPSDEGNNNQMEGIPTT